MTQRTSTGYARGIQRTRVITWVIAAALAVSSAVIAALVPGWLAIAGVVIAIIVANLVHTVLVAPMRARALNRWFEEIAQSDPGVALQFVDVPYLLEVSTGAPQRLDALLRQRHPALARQAVVTAARQAQPQGSAVVTDVLPGAEGELSPGFDSGRLSRQASTLLVGAVLLVLAAFTVGIAGVVASHGESFAIALGIGVPLLIAAGISLWHRETLVIPRRRAAIYEELYASSPDRFVEAEHTRVAQLGGTGTATTVAQIVATLRREYRWLGYWEAVAIARRITPASE